MHPMTTDAPTITPRHPRTQIDKMQQELVDALQHRDEEAAAKLQQRLEDAEEGGVLALEGDNAEPRGWGAAACAAGGLSDAQVQSLEEAMHHPRGQGTQWDIDEELVVVKPKRKMGQKKKRVKSDAQRANELLGMEVREEGKKHVVLAVMQRRPRSGGGWY